MNTIRHAEKNRTSTCIFADIVAKLVIKTFKLHTPIEHLNTFSNQSTVLSAFILLNRHVAENYTEQSQPLPLTVVSFGVGTKYMSTQDITKDIKRQKIHDCHSEVLAKRGFAAFCINLLKQGTSDKQDVLVFDEKLKLYSLNKKYELVFYTSSAPCGNAVIKRWVKGKKEKYSNEFDDKMFSYPKPSHEKIHFQSLHQGQIAPLVKLDTSVYLVPLIRIISAQER